MATASIILQQGVRSGNFNIGIIFDIPVNIFNINDLVLINTPEISGSSQPSISGISGSGSNYNVNITVPPGISGTLTLSFTSGALVTPVDGSPIEPVISTPVNISYSTITSITARIGRRTDQQGISGTLDISNVIRNSDGTIDVPIIFGENLMEPIDISSFSKTDLMLERLSGSNIYGMLYWLTGPDDSNQYLISFLPELNTNGFFKLGFSGKVIHNGNSVNVDADPITIGYDRRVPFVTGQYLPVSFNRTDSVNTWTVYVAFNVRIKELNINSFEYQGVNLYPEKIQRLEQIPDNLITNASNPDFTDTDNTAIIFSDGNPNLVANGDLGVNTQDNSLYIRSSGTVRQISRLSEFFSVPNPKWLGFNNTNYGEIGSNLVNSDNAAKEWILHNLPGGIPADTTYFWSTGSSIRKMGSNFIIPNTSQTWQTPNPETDWVDIDTAGNTVASKFFRIIFDITNVNDDNIEGILNLILRESAVVNAEFEINEVGG